MLTCVISLACRIDSHTSGLARTRLVKPGSIGIRPWICYIRPLQERHISRGTASSSQFQSIQPVFDPFPIDNIKLKIYRLAIMYSEASPTSSAFSPFSPVCWDDKSLATKSIKSSASDTTEKTRSRKDMKSSRRRIVRACMRCRLRKTKVSLQHSNECTSANGD